MVKPGVHWDSIHLHTHKVLVDGFIKLGIFTGDAQEILQSGVTAGFYPHGLGGHPLSRLMISKMDG